MMPILVRWEWQEVTKSFLVIFFFYDDYSKNNIRFGKITRQIPKNRYSFGEKQGDWVSYSKEMTSVEKQHSDRVSLTQSAMNWAPSHVELGYLGEVLRYANIVDGLGEPEKRNLRIDLEHADLERVLGKKYSADEEKLSILWDEFEKRASLFKVDESSVHFAGIELCDEYIEFLATVLSPYMKKQR